MHLLLWLQSKIRPNKIDAEISTELICKEVDPALYDIMSKHMIHLAFYIQVRLACVIEFAQKNVQNSFKVTHRLIMIDILNIIHFYPLTAEKLLLYELLK